MSGPLATMVDETGQNRRDEVVTIFTEKVIFDAPA